MVRASASVNEAQRKQIEDAVSSAESRTSAELVPVIAASSGRYDRAEDLFGLLLAGVMLSLTWLWYPRRPEDGSWDLGPESFELAAFLLAMLLGFTVGAAIASRVGWIRHLFTPRRQMSDEVNLRARQVFFDSRVHHTRGATGILFYVSLYERTAVILADEKVTSCLGQGVLDTLCKQLVADMRNGNLVDALANAIRSAGGQLAGVLPRAADDSNEISNALVLID